MRNRNTTSNSGATQFFAPLDRGEKLGFMLLVDSLGSDEATEQFANRT